MGDRWFWLTTEERKKVTERRLKRIRKEETTRHKNMQRAIKLAKIRMAKRTNAAT
jgi:hypothetical protein